MFCAFFAAGVSPPNKWPPIYDHTGWKTPSLQRDGCRPVNPGPAQDRRFIMALVVVMWLFWLWAMAVIVIEVLEVDGTDHQTLEVDGLAIRKKARADSNPRLFDINRFLQTKTLNAFPARGIRFARWVLSSSSAEVLDWGLNYINWSSNRVIVLSKDILTCDCFDGWKLKILQKSTCSLIYGSSHQ